MKSSITVCSILLLLLLPINSALSQVNLPTDFSVYLPKIINEQNPNSKGIGKTESWQDWCVKRVKSSNLGSLTQTIWTVYSDRKNNTTYQNPNTSQKFTSLNFMEKVYIADIKNGFALVFTDDYVPNAPSINSTAKSKGWIPVENLLLWNICPKNKNHIYQKGVVVLDPEKSKKGNDDQSPYYLLAPDIDIKNPTQRAKKLDILFVLKKQEVDGQFYYLLSKLSNIENKETTAVLGWLSESHITEWDQRLCLEATYNNNAVTDYQNRNIQPSIFATKSESENFYNQNSTPKAFWIDNDFDKTRMDAYDMRAPILDVDEPLHKNNFKVASISSISIKETKERLDNTKDIEKLKLMQQNVNIIFVIDATSSMKNYYDPVAKALEKVMRRDLKNNIKVGVVLYRDYPDNERTIEHFQVTGKIDDVISFINRKKEDVGSIAKEVHEALYLGLETALDFKKMNYDPKHSNFIFLIGDAGNHPSDPKGYSCDKIATKMANFNINFIAYQANHANSDPYTDFAMQMKEIINTNVNLQCQNLNTHVKFELRSNKLYMASRLNSSSFTPVFGGYSYASPGKPQSTSELEKIIVSETKAFDELINSRIEILEGNTIALTSDGNLNETVVVEILVKWGWDNARIEKYIKDLKSNGVAKLIGYAPLKIKKSAYNLFEYVLFFDKNELSNIVNELKKLESKSNVSQRKAYQDAIIAMGQAFLGQLEKEEIIKMSIDELLAQIYGIPVKIESCGIKIEEINKVEDSILEKLIDDFRHKTARLQRIINNEYDGRFVLSGQSYYWIPFSDMPGFCITN